MIIFVLSVTLLGLLCVGGWGVLWGGIFPLGAVLALPVLYFSWRWTLVICLLTTLVWESFTPIGFGVVAVPVTVGCLILQLLGRHQLRANVLTKIFAAVAIQSVAILFFGSKFPPQTVAGALLQLCQTVGLLAGAGAGAVLWLLAMNALAKKYFKTNLESRLKDL